MNSPIRPSIYVGIWLSACAVLAFSGCQTTPSTTAASELTRAAAIVRDTPDSKPANLRSARRAYRTALVRALPDPVVAGQASGFYFPEMPSPDYRNVGQFSRIELIKKSPSTGSSLVRDGIGLPAYGVVPPNSNHFTPVNGQLVPITLIASQSKSSKAEPDTFAAHLANPFELNRVKFDGREMPLAMDLETVIQSTKALGPGPLFGFLVGIHSNRFGDSRLSFLQPYDPEKIPLVLVHGLFSTPRMWVPVVQKLWANETIRRRYQIWFFFYPNGQPIPASALELRDALDRVVAKYQPKPMVLVGHSMGGILVRSQVSQLTLDQVKPVMNQIERLPEQSLARRALIFEPRPYVSRVVFIATPHRGSDLARHTISEFGMSLIRLPDRIRLELLELQEFGFKDSRGRLPTSIHGLSPKSRFLQALSNTRPVVPSHSIIGIRGAKSPEGSSDGVVPYESAHVPFAVSEVNVPSGHGAHANPEALSELVRILLEAK